MPRLILSSLALLLLSTASAPAQGTERYLPSGSQLVLQMDPPEKTKAAFDQTAVGKMWNGETGQFFLAFYRYLVEAGELAARQYKLPAEDVALAKDAVQFAEKV